MNLTNEQLQVILTGTFGDGCVINLVNASSYSTNSIYPEYMEYKKNLLGDMCPKDIQTRMNQGYKIAPIHKISTLSFKDIQTVHNLSIQEKLELLTPLGISLWVYDDGSLHNKNLFYNLNTHAFSEEVHQELFVPFFDKNGYGKPKILKDRKKDGREFSYLYFNKHEGGYKINKLLNEYPVSCFEYKRWPKNFEEAWDKVKSENQEPCSRSAFSRKVKSYLNTTL